MSCLLAFADGRVLTAWRTCRLFISDSWASCFNFLW